MGTQLIFIIVHKRNFANGQLYYLCSHVISFYSPQIFRDGGAGDDRAAVQRGVRVGVPAAGGERGDHGQHAAHRRHGLRHRVRVHRPLQGHARHCQQPLAVM